MKIFISHSSSFDYQNELYKPIKESQKLQQHDIVFPHDGEVVNTKDVIDAADILIAEVSYPSTGQGIELGWSDDRKTPIIAIHQKDKKPSGSIKFVAKEVTSYSSIEDMIIQIESYIQ